MCDSFLGEGKVGVKSGVQVALQMVCRRNPSLPLRAFQSRPSRWEGIKKTLTNMPHPYGENADHRLKSSIGTTNFAVYTCRTSSSFSLIIPTTGNVLE
jgi:hypothetical protein